MTVHRRACLVQPGVIRRRGHRIAHRAGELALPAPQRRHAPCVQVGMACLETHARCATLGRTLRAVHKGASRAQRGLGRLLVLRSASRVLKTVPSASIPICALGAVRDMGWLQVFVRSVALVSILLKERAGAWIVTLGPIHLRALQAAQTVPLGVTLVFVLQRVRTVIR
jgi:hypothetical protein